MEENKHILHTDSKKGKPVVDLKPIQELKGFDFAKSDGLVCDMETGICGPQNQEKESKE